VYKSEHFPNFLPFLHSERSLGVNAENIDLCHRPLESQFEIIDHGADYGIDGRLVAVTANTLCCDSDHPPPSPPPLPQFEMF